MSASNDNRLPARRVLPHDVPPWVEDGSIYFVTICCQKRGLNQLCTDNVSSIVIESVAFRQTRLDCHVRLLVLMPDHLHMLVSFPRDLDLRKIIAGWKSLVARKTGVHWQRDFFDHRLRQNESLAEKEAYIRLLRLANQPDAGGTRCPQRVQSGLRAIRSTYSCQSIEQSPINPVRKGLAGTPGEWKYVWEPSPRRTGPVRPASPV